MNEPTAYDVFISHAYEDKNAFADELAVALRDNGGLKVWYSGFDLKLGDSISDSINKALKGAKYAIVIISPIYIEKQLAMSELYALFTQEAEQNRILPIFHNITVAEVKKHLPMLADRYAISSDQEMSVIVRKVAEAINGEKNFTSNPNKRIENKNNPTSNSNKNQDKKTTKSTSAILFILLVLIVSILGYYLYNSNHKNALPRIHKDAPSNSGIKQTNRN